MPSRALGSFTRPVVRPARSPRQPVGRTRRKFFEIAELKKAPIAIEAVRRIDALFAIEREINGMTAEGRRAVRANRSRPLVTALEAWLREHRAKLSAKSEVAKAIDYLLNRWPSFTGFLEDGRICLSNNAAERAIRGIAVGRRNWTFAGSDAGGRRAAALYTLIETAKLNDVDPHAWLADVLKRLPDHPASACTNSCLDLENRADPARRGVIPAEGLFVIDNPAQVEQLIAKLKAACRSPPRSVRPCWPSCKSRRRTSLCRPDARSPGSTMPGTKAGSSANSILGLRTIRRCFSCRSRI